MKIAVWTKNLAVISETEKNIIKFAADFYANALMSPRIVKNLNITINIVDGLNKKQRFLGLAGPKDTADERYPREFVIDLDRQKKLKSILQVLAHEMTHVKQYAKGELKYHDRNNLVTFNKEKYTDDDYWMSPWEIEACGYEICLYQKFHPTYKMLLREARRDNSYKSKK
jgi:hypothetical protein